MPSLGADMDAGTVAQWLVKAGDRVTRGDFVAVVATDKADIEVEVFDSGTVEEILVPEGERVPVGTVLARIRDEAPEVVEVSSAPRPGVPRAEPPPAPEARPAKPSPTPPLAGAPPSGEGARR